MNIPLISIIIPVYNAERYINRCIDSALNQSYNNTEIVIVNDGSKDNSHNIISQYAIKHKNIKYISQTNQGAGETRKAGVLNATGEYITFVDADDWLPDNALEILYNRCIEYQLDYAAGIPYVYFSETNITLSPRALPGIFSGEESLSNLLSPNGNLPNWGAISKRNIWSADLFPVHNIPAEDNVINIKLTRNIKRAGVFNDLYVYHYYLNPDSLTSTGCLFKQNLWKLFAGEIRKDLKNRNILDKYEQNIRLIEIDRLAFNTDLICKNDEWIKSIYKYGTSGFPTKYKILHALIKHPYLCKKSIHFFHKIKGYITNSKRR